MNETTTTEDPVRLEGFGPRDLYQRREKIFTRFVGGFFQRLRFFSGWPLLAGYLLLPWVNFEGRQAVLFDLPARQFHIFNGTFYPQDLWLLGWLLIIAAFGLFTITTLVGRLWCGYTCPQTVWTAVFMWAEQVAEGPRHARIRLDQAPWSFDKVFRRLFKHGMWIGWAILTGIAFVGYFSPIRELVVEMSTFTASGWSMFWIAFFSAATYLNAGWLREQVCLHMCPYARFQSAMFDKDTLIVSYDSARGEPRGSRKRSQLERATIEPADQLANTDPVKGDCIDCQLCVQVCPVGIDIRDGLQYECIGCAHCIDACNQVMGKMSYPQGLIRYTTEHELTGGRSRWLRGRSVGYAAALMIMMIAFSIAILSRSTFEVDILRERGDLFRTNLAGQIVNQYSLRVLNKSQQVQSYYLAIDSDLPLTVAREDRLIKDLHTQPGERLDLSLTLLAARESIALPSIRIKVSLCETESSDCVSEQTSFFGPLR